MGCVALAYGELNLEAAGISVTEGVTAPGTSAFGNIQASGYISAEGNVITQGELATEGGLTSDGDVQINANAVATRKCYSYKFYWRCYIGHKP